MVLGDLVALVTMDSSRIEKLYQPLQASIIIGELLVKVADRVFRHVGIISQIPTVKG